MDADRCCVACDFYVKPATASQAMRDAGRLPSGFCNRFPQSQAKKVTDWCGEHRNQGKATFL